MKRHVRKRECEENIGDAKHGQKNKEDSIDKLKKELLFLEKEKEKIISDLDEENTRKTSTFKDLRDKSRHLYLQKREKQRIKLLEVEIADESLMFVNESLTQKEIDEFEFKKKILKIAKEKKRLENESCLLEYNIPDGNLGEIEALQQKKHHRDEDSQGHAKDEWEENQYAKNVLRQEKDEKGDYEFLFDKEQIQFILKAVSESDVKKDDVVGKGIEGDKHNLPIFQFKNEFINAMSEHQTLIVVGETGSGKTTQIPQYLVEMGLTENGKKIGCTQPRRVAVMSVAKRVSEEMNTKLGIKVGYSMRFEDCTSDKTIVKYMTDGSLLREFLSEPDLESYSCIMIDEAHERTVHTDILLGLIKDVSRYRKDLKVVISSATLDANRFSEYFDYAPIFNIPGRLYSVDVYYTKLPEPDYLKASVITVMQIHASQPPGDILVFLTGQEEIEIAAEALNHIAKTLEHKIKGLVITPIYSSLPSEMQIEIFQPTPQDARKVVLATNIAETSITIHGIGYVIDPGFIKQKSYNPKTGLESLVVVPISQASANQRLGRAGRVGPGKCFRLYTSWSYHHELEPSNIPEIQRTDISHTVLLLKSFGINDLIHFDFMDAPPIDTLIKSMELLYSLGALNKYGELTKIGRKMAELPLNPMLSKTLVSSETYGCSEEIISICSMFSVQSGIFYRPKDKKALADNIKKSFFRKGGDHLMLLDIWNQWVESGYSSQWCYENFIQVKNMRRARDVREQLASLLKRIEIELVSNCQDSVGIRKCIASGYFYHCARLNRDGNGYKNIKNNLLMFIHPSSSLFCSGKGGKLPPKWIIYHELVLTTKEYMRQCIEIDPEWLVEVAPHCYKDSEIQDLIRYKKDKTS